MGEAGEIEIFQRWLQSKLAASEHIEDPSERDRRRLHIESAISETIFFRESLEKLESLESPAPFIERSTAVRALEKSPQAVSTKDGKNCIKCSSELASDLDFCPSCGEEN
tara:strand:+ start:218 stop:547 length:330 start_codon:yes stop_codon:yes gene_type:complete